MHLKFTIELNKNVNLFKINDNKWKKNNNIKKL